MVVNMKAFAASTTQSVPAMQLEISEQAPKHAPAPSASYGATHCIALSFWRSSNVRVPAWSIFYLTIMVVACALNACAHIFSIALVGALLPQLTFPALAHNPKSRLGNVDIGQAA